MQNCACSASIRKKTRFHPIPASPFRRRSDRARPPVSDSVMFAPFFFEKRLQFLAFYCMIIPTQALFDNPNGRRIPTWPIFAPIAAPL